MPRSAAPWASASRTRKSAALPSRTLLLVTGKLGDRVVQQLALARPGMLERPAVLRFEAQPERLLELSGGRGDALRGKVHQQRRGDQHALADRIDRAFGDAPAMQPDIALFEIGSQAELAVRGHSRRKAPRRPAAALAR